jgi:hypothetical protein
VLFDLTGGYGAAFSVAGITINEAERPACRAVTLPGRPHRPHPVAGGR